MLGRQRLDGFLRIAARLRVTSAAVPWPPELTARGIPTATGKGQWTAVGVKRVIERATME